ncbi:MAG: hypothetical protein ACOCWB_01745 [Bacteroidota bacterium]
MYKIGIAGCYGTGKTLLSLALSEFMGLPRAHVENLDVLYEDIYGIPKNPHDFSVSEMLSMGLARFHSRIKQEHKDGFISDGTVLNELAYGKARMNMQKKFNKLTVKKILFGSTYIKISKRLEKTIINYAQNNYDTIYFLQTQGDDEGEQSEFHKLFNHYFIEILIEHAIPYKILIGNLEDSFSEIIADYNISPVPRKQINKLIAQQHLIKKNFPAEYQFAKQ